MKVTQTTQAWGNSTGIRIPKKVLNATKWQKDQLVSIDIKGNSIVLTPIKKSIEPSSTDDKLPTLDELLRGVTPKKVGGELDWGPPVGKEIW